MRYTRPVRIWFGLTYLVSGAVGMIWGLAALVVRHADGIYLVAGGFLVGALGWFIQPWGSRRVGPRSSSER
jgi:hypothetical protein